MPNFNDITGKRFNNLTVLSRAENSGKRVMWKCLCDCGGEIITRSDSLKTGHTVSCGCVSKTRLAQHREKHGKVGSRVYSIWQGMKNRCINESSASYSMYGGRGIYVCDEWLDFNTFYKDMGDPPKSSSIERIDNNKGYCKENCKWATSYEQSRNKRSNVNISWNGKKMVLEDWAAHLNINIHTLYARVIRYKWTIERAFTQQVNTRKI